MTNDPVASGPVAIAALSPLTHKPLEQMSYWELWTHILLKILPMILVSSVVLSMIGVGGGFIYVPVLIACGIDFHTAATTSLIMLSCASLMAAFNFYKSGFVDLRTAVIFEIPTILGAFVGGVLAHHFHVHILTVAFSCTLFLASYMMMQQDLVLLGASKEQGTCKCYSPLLWQHEFKGNQIRIDLGLAVPIGIIVGYIGGTLGFAGGWLKVPVMVLLFNIPMKIAVATSSLMVPVTGIAGFLGHSINGHFEPRLALTLSAITMVGAYIGSRISIGTESGQLRVIFAFVLSIVGVFMLTRTF